MTPLLAAITVVSGGGLVAVLINLLILLLILGVVYWIITLLAVACDRETGRDCRARHHRPDLSAFPYQLGVKRRLEELLQCWRARTRRIKTGNQVNHPRGVPPALREAVEVAELHARELAKVLRGK